MAWVEDEATMYVAQYVGQYKLSFDLQMIVRSRFVLGGAQHMGAGMFRMSPRAERWVGGSTHGGGRIPIGPIGIGGDTPAHSLTVFSSAVTKGQN